MRSSIFLAVILVACLAVSAANPVIEGAVKAKKEGKMLILYFTADWCGWCHKLKDNTLKDPNVVKIMDKHTVLFMVDKDKNKKLAKKYGVRGIPCLVFFEPMFVEIDRIVGYRDAEKFIQSVNDMRNGVNTFQTLQEQAASGHVGYEVNLALADKYMERAMHSKAKEQFLAARKAGAKENDVVYGLGQVEQNKKNYDKAASLFEKALEGSLDSQKIYTLCICYYYGKDYINCIQACNRLIRTDPVNEMKMQPFAYYVKGLCFRMLESREDSDRAWKKVTENFPEHYFANQIRNAWAKEEAEQKKDKE